VDLGDPIGAVQFEHIETAMTMVMSERHLDLKGKQVAVIGFGRSGQAAVRLLLELGARVAIADQKPEAELMPLTIGLDPRRVQLYGGGKYEPALRGADLIMMSPGVPVTLEPIQQARASGARIIGELELASRYVEGKIIAVTGTNGKSTTVTLTGELLRAADFDPFVGGNLGTPLAKAALDSLHGRRWDLLVTEVSSFQLETIETFHPWIGAILNITPDHLDRYPSFEAYAQAKGRLFENQTGEDYCVLNADDPGLTNLRPRTEGRCVGFSRKAPVQPGVFLQDDRIFSTLGSREEEVIRTTELQLRGVHNLENVMAATAMAQLAGCPMMAIQRGLREFRGLEHVMEMVRVLHGVTYINDSKGTNVDATIKALESLAAPVILIAGGREKGGDYPGLAEAVGTKAKHVILIGEARTRLRQILHGVVPMSEAANLREAVRAAAASAVAGDTVLLSPVCASFDMFQDYKDRGRQFKECVHELA
jgi:UDP-N-acetylmuramoylalanine--D-glutamate ligase